MCRDGPTRDQAPARGHHDPPRPPLRGLGGGRCTCHPAYQAQVFSPRDRRTIRKSLPSLAEARAWRADTKAALQKGTLRAPTRTTLAEAADDWLSAARAGIARTRSGDPYKPSALRSYEHALATKVLPELGPMRLSAVDRVCVQDLVDRLVARGLAPSTVRNSVLPLRAVFRRAVARALRSSRTRPSGSRCRRSGEGASASPAPRRHAR